ncbi:MAG: hypothetical protein Q9172_002657 [Xanthocarpia lactea]
MAFYETSRDVKLNSDLNLQAKCMNMRKEWEASTFLLTQNLGNNDGNLVWGGCDFDHSARDVTLRENRFLEGKFQALSGEWKYQSLDLGQYIASFDGALRAFDDKQDHLADDSWHGADCYIVHKASGLCLELDNGNSGNGTTVKGCRCIPGNPNQIWHLEKADSTTVLSAWILRNKASGTNLDLSDGNPADEAEVQGWQQTAGEYSQRWFLTAQQEGCDAGFMFVAQDLLR